MTNLKIHLSIFILLFSVSGFSQIVVQSQAKNAKLPYGIMNEKQWEKVHIKWESRNYQAKIYLYSGNKIDGQLLFRNDTATFFLNSIYEFLNPLDLFEQTGYVLNSEIDKIVINDYWRNKDGITKGAIIGLGVGLGMGFAIHGVGLGATYSLGAILIGSTVSLGIPTMSLVENMNFNAPDILIYDEGKEREDGLSKYIFFADHLPPTLKIGNSGLMVKEGEKEFLPVRELYKTAPSARRVFAQPKISLFPHFISSQENGVVGGEGISVAFNINHRHSLDYQYGTVNHYYSSDLSLLKSREEAFLVTHGANYSAKLLSKGKFQHRNLEIFLSGGPTINKVNSEVRYALYSSGIPVTDWMEYKVEDVIYGWRIMAGFDLYLSKYFSLRLSYGHHEINVQEIPENLTLHPETNTMKGIEAHELDFSGRLFYWGLRIHF